MPNKYSHAFVLSNYQSHGLIDFNRPRSSKTPSSSSSSSSSTCHNSTARGQKYNAPSLKADRTSPQSTSSNSVLVGSSNRTNPKPAPPPLHRRSSSTETQIYAPILPPIVAPTASKKKSNDFKSLEQSSSRLPPHQSKVRQDVHPHTRGSTYHLVGSPSVPPALDSHQTVSYETHQNISQRYMPSQPASKQPNRSLTKAEPFGSRNFQSQLHKPKSHHILSAANIQSDPHSTAAQNRTARSRYLDRGFQSGIASVQPIQPAHDRYARVPLSAGALAPERPPSPPATPESAKSFSLVTPTKRPDPISLPPPVPERNARRSPREPSSKPQSVTNLALNEPSRPKTSPASESASCNSFSTSARTSTFNTASSLVYSSRTSTMPSNVSSEDKPQLAPVPGIFDMLSHPFLDDDADLESLPSTLDSNILPWTDENIGPAIFRDCELNSRRSSFVAPESTRASSFDSAAPPPIGMNRHLPPALAETTSPATPITPKKTKPRTASFSFFRSTPKAILYSQTRPGTPPLPVTVPRTPNPSIPALFPDYKGKFPPQERDERRSRPSRASRNASREPKKRGFSVPPKASGRRLSWLRVD